MMKNEKSRIYLVMDSQGHPLGQAMLESPPDLTHAMQFRLLEDDPDDAEIAAAELHKAGRVRLLSMGSSDLPIECQVLRHRRERVVMEKLATLDSEVRRNLRVSLQFNSFFFPVTGHWKGRRRAEFLNISCGGVAFHSDADLHIGERIEMVVPTMVNPVLLKCEILRTNDEPDGRKFYAGKFVNTCDDEETIVREAVFNIQLESRYQSRKKNVENIKKEGAR